MADVTGPIGSLPGSHHPVPEGATCDECGQPATVRIQGETDSFGSEMSDLCDTCKVAYGKESEELRHGTCDWCKTHKDDLAPTRDYDEGSAGPVYRVCLSCRFKQSEDARKELEWMHRNDPEEFSADDGYSDLDEG